MTKPVTRSSTPGAAPPVDPAPPSLQQVLDEMRAMKSELLTVLDTKTSTTAMELDYKISTVSEELTTKIMDLSHEIEVSSTDIDMKVSNHREQVDDTIESFVDTAIGTAHMEWSGNITDVAQKFRNYVSETETKIASRLHWITTKLADLVNRNLSDSTILEVLDGSTLDHVRSLILSTVVDDSSFQGQFSSSGIKRFQFMQVYLEH